MKLLLFRLTTAGEAPDAVVTLEGGAARVETGDPALHGAIEAFMATPLVVRRPVGKERGVLAFREVMLAPRSEEFFREAVYALRPLGFRARLEGTRWPHLLALDFDGVLWDSVHECFVVGRLAYLTMGRQFPATRVAEELFRQGRPFCRTGLDFYVVFRALEENPRFSFERCTVEEFAGIRERYRKDAEEYEPIFYEERHRVMEDDPAGWAALQSPFPGILAEMDRLKEMFARVVVATTKDERSARHLLFLHHLSLEIVGKEISVDKVAQMRHLAARHEIPFDRILFVDDLLEQVEEVRALGVTAALASWGYTTAAHRQRATELGIPVLEIPNLHGQLEALLPKNQNT